MNPLRLVTLLPLLAFILPAGTSAAPPNVVFILADDLGARDLGCFGSKFYRTPNLDQLAKAGMKFTEAYAAAPVCSPTRAAIMTGKTPARLQLTDWLPGRPDRPDQRLAIPRIRQQLPLAETTLAEAFKAAGYATAHIGKWHLGGEGFHPEQQGFDANHGGDHAGSPAGWFAPFERKLRDGSVRRIPHLDDAPKGRYLTDALTDRAVEFIAEHRAKPFFLYLAHYTVHIPLAAPADLVAKYPTLNDQRGVQTNRIYAAMIESLDNSVGRIVKQLEDLELTRNTIIVFTSDNGGLCTLEGPNTPATYNAPFREGKGFLYEGGLRVPLIVKWPARIAAESICATPVCSFDFFPTLLAATGLKPAAGQAFDGTDLTPLLNGQSIKDRPLFWHYPHYSNQGGKPGSAMRQGKWKLIQHFEDGRLELYDISRGGEGVNLVEQEAATATRMVNQLEAWRRETGAQMMLPNPGFRPTPPDAQGVITLAGKHADIHGTMLRFEPMPHKNTLGYWVNETDWASWEFQTTRPGTYEIIATQGCGRGQGGSTVEFAVGNQKLTLTVADTGHFQNFADRNLGRIEIAHPGRHILTVKPLKKAKAAVMDLPKVVLRPVI